MEYHIVVVGMIEMDRASEGLSALAAQGWRIISVNTLGGAMVWTMQRKPIKAK